MEINNPAACSPYAQPPAPTIAQLRAMYFADGAIPFALSAEDVDHGPELDLLAYTVPQGMVLVINTLYLHVPPNASDPGRIATISWCSQLCDDDDNPHAVHEFTLSSAHPPLVLQFPTGVVFRQGVEMYMYISASSGLDVAVSALLTGFLMPAP